MIYYKQCILENRDCVLRVAWIPEQFAKNGKYIKLKINGKWSDGWQVVNVGTKMSEEYVMESERDFTHQREASDI